MKLSSVARGREVSGGSSGAGRAPPDHATDAKDTCVTRTINNLQRGTEVDELVLYRFDNRRRPSCWILANRHGQIKLRVNGNGAYLSDYRMGRLR